MKRILSFLVLIGAGIIYAEKAPFFNAKLLNGKHYAVDSLLGKKVTIISFWATWCVPCKHELDAINEIYKVYKDSGFQVIAVNTDSPRNLSKVKPMVKAHGWNFPIVLDPSGEIKRLFNVRSLPTSFYVYSDRVVFYHVMGYTKRDKPEIKKRILHALKKEYKSNK